MSAPPRASVLRLLDRPLPRRLLTGARSAGPAVADAVRVAGEVVARGRPVSVEHRPHSSDAAAELGELVAALQAAGLVATVELTLPVDRLGADAAARLGGAAREAGLSVALGGPPAEVAAVTAGLPGATVIVPAGEPDAERRCRALAGGRVRLLAGRGPGADLRFVRCLNVLMAAGGTPEVATTDRRMIAITGERAAWNGRSPDSWEYVMPHGVRTEHEQRLSAAGYTVRIAVASGPGVFGGRRS
jgi:proline dehydrogenase